MLYQIAAFVFTQIPDLHWSFDVKEFAFVSKYNSQAVLYRTYVVYCLMFMIMNIIMTAIWYVLVCVKVKQKVRFLFSTDRIWF